MGSSKLPVTKSGYYKFKILYSYEGADGQKELSAKTDKQVRLPNEVFMDISSVSPEIITEPGDMTFTLNIENGTAYELRNLSITEENNLFEKIELTNIVIPAMKNGTAGTYTYRITVAIPATDTRVRFNLSYNINGEVSTINTSYDVRFALPGQTATPTISVTATPDNTVDDEGSNLLIWVLICILILLILLILIIVLLFLRKGKGGPEEPHSVKRRIGAGYADDEDDSDDYYDDDELEEIPVDESYGGDVTDSDYDDDGVKIYRGRK